MNSNKLTQLKKVIEYKLSSFDFDGEIKKYEKQLTKIYQTPADEYSNSGNIEHGIINILEVAIGVNHPIGYLVGQRRTYQEILELFKKSKNELEKILNPPSYKDEDFEDFIKNLESSDKEPVKKHFFDCKLTDEEWGSENCICPGAYVYRKYLSIGLSEEEAKLIFTYSQIGNTMGEEYEKAKQLYEKHKFLKINKQVSILVTLSYNL